MWKLRGIWRVNASRALRSDDKDIDAPFGKYIVSTPVAATAGPLLPFCSLHPHPLPATGRRSNPIPARQVDRGASLHSTSRIQDRPV
ncbi:Hypothetical protein NTJ_03409 [Nesidiocoris tenuis]|uniref:Uncharacterized protein n=1 Tax=Nesidiocoris tenuis TaxID=355587 RepID=A0ABN7AI89_9HEMI|nr:Hypothetical protein NTJ_03409 [Nesidiocoris tenuis]